MEIERFDYLTNAALDDDENERRRADRSQATFYIDCSLTSNGLDTPFYIVGQEPIMKLEDTTSDLTTSNVRRYKAPVRVPMRDSVTVINAFCDSHDALPKSPRLTNNNTNNSNSNSNLSVIRHVKGWQRNRHVIVARHPDVVDGVRARRRRLELPERFSERAAPHNARPLNVLLLTIDSLANAHYQRTFKQTIAFFDRMQAERRSTTFKFERYHVLGWHSDQNQPGYYAGSNTIATTNVEARRFGSLLG